MVSVYYWHSNPKLGRAGHASMRVDNTYISWWPEEPGNPKEKRSVGLSTGFSFHPYRNRSFEADKAAEKPVSELPVLISGLDEKAIKNWWQGLGLVRDGRFLEGPLLPWSLVGRNCSTVVATGLTVGGGNAYAKWL